MMPFLFIQSKGKFKRVDIEKIRGVLWGDGWWEIVMENNERFRING
jgi:hypothetical protein